MISPTELSELDLNRQSNLMALLPMVYVAWADAVLEPAEIEAIGVRMQAQTWLTAEEKAILGRWLDPHSPPSQKELNHWLTLMREATSKIDKSPRQTLAELGIQIGSLQADPAFNNPEIKAALEAIELALGVVPADAAHHLSNLIKEEVRPLRPLVERDEPAFDLDAMTALFDRDFPQIKAKMRQILNDPAFDYVHFDNKDDYRDHVLHWCQLLADEGIGSLGYPKAVGGAGDMGGYLAALEMLAHHDLSLLIKFGVQFGLFGGSIALLGTERHHQQYLPDVATLALPGCFAMTELGHGSNVRDIETTATFDRENDRFIIHTPSDQARKEYIGNAARHGRLATVFAQLLIDGESYGVNAFLVPIRDESGRPLPGVRIQDNGQKLGLNGVDNGRLWFDQVSVPRDNMLDRFAQVTADGEYLTDITGEARRFFTMIGTLVGGRVGIGLSANSAAKNGLTIAIRYANRRRQFGPAQQEETLLIDYPVHQRRLLPLLANAYALDFGLKYLLERYINRTPADEREVETLAAGLKAYSTWNATRTLQEGREATGGMGYMARNRIADLKADTDIFTTFEGDNTVLMQLVAKGRLTEFRQQFNDARIWSTAKFIAKQATSSVVDHNPVTARRSGQQHLRSGDWHLNLFKHREEHLVFSAAQRLRHWIGKTNDSYQAMLITQNHLLAVGHAYVERVILERFLAGIAEISNRELKGILEKLAALFALTHIEKEMAWYLEHGDIAPTKSKAIRKEIERLNREIAPQALYLADAFGIPDRLLAAPIGLRDDPL